ncbi:MAG: hypothetical protein D6743_11655 [Calditrichaeota bacterium]|nr:MAG: hypothetical protein D6743_11655 [Calditrichota bacterium]
MKARFSLPLFVFVLFALCSSVSAQSGISNARSVAMSGAFTGLARGVEAPAWNPANLALTARRKYHLNLFSFGVGFHNNSFSKKQYDLYNGAFLTEQDKLDILASIPSDGLRVDLGTEVQAMGISIGNFALTASALGASDFSLSKDIVDLILMGNDLNRTYDVGATSGQGFGVSSFAFSFALPVKLAGFHRFAFGASGKYLLGLVYGEVKEASSSVSTDIDGVHGNGRVVIDRALGGNGLAFDFGVAAQLNESWSMSLGVLNAVSSMKWNKSTKRFIYTFRADSVSAEKLQDSDIDSVVVRSDQTIDIEPFHTTLPPQLRFGLARSTRHWTFDVDYTQGLKKVAGVSTRPRIAFGTELRLIPLLPLRAGIASGGRRGLSSSAGFGLDFSAFSWDFALSSRGGLFSGRGLAVAFDWMFRF